MTERRPLHVLFATHIYWPEDFGGGPWMHEIARGLVARGHRVTVLTTFPNYPAGVVAEGYRGRFFMRERHEGVDIVRTWIHAVPRTEPMGRRALGLLSCTATRVAGALAPRGVDVLMGFSAMPMALADGLIARALQRVPYLMTVQDVFGDSIRAAGFVRSETALRLLDAAEMMGYRAATHISVIGEVFLRNLVRKGVPREKISIVPNSTTSGLTQPVPRDNAFRAGLDIGGDFLVLYSGNMGQFCDLDTLVDAAALLAGEPGYRFLLVGEGLRKAAAQERARGLPNVTFLPLQPGSVFPQVLAAADACVVSLNSDCTEVAVPSKVFSFMAAGRPILAVMEEGNDLARLVRDEGLGACARPGDPRALADEIRKMRQEPGLAEARGRTARDLFLRDYSMDACVQKYEDLLVRVARDGGRAKGR